MSATVLNEYGMVWYGWLSSGGYTSSSTQPYIPPGSLNGVTALAGKGGNATRYFVNLALETVVLLPRNNLDKGIRAVRVNQTTLLDRSRLRIAAQNADAYLARCYFRQHRVRFVIIGRPPQKIELAQHFPSVQ